jgi:hypothetical protein
MGKALIRIGQGYGGHVLAGIGLNEERGLPAVVPRSGTQAGENAAVNIMSCPVGYDLIKICTKES